MEGGREQRMEGGNEGWREGEARDRERRMEGGNKGWREGTKEGGRA